MIEDVQPPLLLSGSWDRALLAPIAEINAHLLETLHLAALAATSAAAVHAAGERARPRLVMLLREDWQGLDTQAQQRLATCPYLLLDAGFGQPERWAPPHTLGIRDALACSGYFGDSAGIALVRRTLLFAWHLARSNRLSARVLLGMSAPAAEHIAACRLQDLDMLAEAAPAWITPRWEQQPRVWRQLLHAARGGQATQLRLAQLRGLQLIAAGCGARGARGVG